YGSFGGDSAVFASQCTTRRCPPPTGQGNSSFHFPASSAPSRGGGVSRHPPKSVRPLALIFVSSAPRDVPSHTAFDLPRCSLPVTTRRIGVNAMFYPSLLFLVRFGL